MADKLNVTDRAVGNWENGRRIPDVVFYKPLCEILGISLNELLSGEKIKESELKEKTDEVLDNTIKYSTKRIKKIKKAIIIGIIVLLFSIFICTFWTDYNRVKHNEEPLFMIRLGENNSKYTYLGFGYKMIRTTAISPFEPLSNSINIKFGFWIFTWDVEVFNPTPRNLWVINGKNRVMTHIGSFCITDTKGDEKASSCGLSIPLEDIIYDEILDSNPEDVVALDSSSDVNITRITFYDSNYEKVDVPISYEKNNFTVPKLKGNYIILIDTICDRGTAWYSFKLKIN
ncbi:MAG: helix-turn-helix transcriptional regulator [Bacilli bacterium]|nr:helix-turn-helix transcriptional regulator [Bacilli bacterium]